MTENMPVIYLTSNIRTEEKKILAELVKAGLKYEHIDVRKKVFNRDLEHGLDGCVVFNRCMSQTQSLACIRYYESMGLRCINSSKTISLCGDKQAMTMALQAAHIPTPQAVFALDRNSALKAIQEIGFPVVIKPSTGSWGRLVVRAHNMDSAEAILDLRQHLTGPQHRLHYIQKYIDTKNQDIRVIMIDNDIVAAYRRVSDHWITNAARGAKGVRMHICSELERICRATSHVAGGGVLSIDLFDTEDGGFLVNEVNHTSEFALAGDVTNINIAEYVVEYLREHVSL